MGMWVCTGKYRDASLAVTGYRINMDGVDTEVTPSTLRRAMQSGRYVAGLKLTDSGRIVDFPQERYNCIPTLLKVKKISEREGFDMQLSGYSASGAIASRATADLNKMGYTFRFLYLDHQDKIPMPVKASFEVYDLAPKDSKVTVTVEVSAVHCGYELRIITANNIGPIKSVEVACPLGSTWQREGTIYIEKYALQIWNKLMKRHYKL